LRLAGLLAATRGLPITVLPLSAGGDSKGARARGDEDETADRAEASVQAAAAEHGEREKDKDDKPEAPDVLIRKPRSSGPEAVADEAKKGYDLLFLGIARTRARGGAFHQDVTRIVATFDGPLAVVAAQGVHLREPERAALHILMPVNGTAVSRRAAEVAIAIARASGSSISALYVADSPSRSRRRNLRANREEQAIIKDIVEMADRYDVKAKVAVRPGRAPAEVILAEAKEANKKADTLIVLGVSRHPGENLSFGGTAAAVFENAPGSFVFIAT
jgi:nucleotide-binding universal stress UspA family protein